MSCRYRVLFFFFFCQILFIFVPREVIAQDESHKDTGWFKLRANLGEYFLLIDDDYSSPILVQRGDSVPVDPGTWKLTIVSPRINDFSFTLAILPDQTSEKRIAFSSYPFNPRTSYHILKQQYNVIINTDPKSVIYVDGELAGEYSVKLLLPKGEHRIHIKHPVHGELTKKIETVTHEVLTINRYNKNPVDLSFAVKLIPGAGYISTKRYEKLALTYSLLGGLAGYFIYQNKNYKSKLEEFEYWTELYLNTTTTSEAIAYRKEAVEVRSSLKSINKHTIYSAIFFGAIYMATTWDGMQKPKDGYKGRGQIKLQPQVLNNHIQPGISYTYYF